MLYPLKIHKSSRKKKIYLHHQKPTEQELVSPTNDIWVARWQTKTGGQIQSWEVKKELVGRKMATNDMSSQLMAACQWHFQLSSIALMVFHGGWLVQLDIHFLYSMVSKGV